MLYSHRNGVWKIKMIKTCNEILRQHKDHLDNSFVRIVRQGTCEEILYRCHIRKLQHLNLLEMIMTFSQLPFKY